MAAEEGLLFVNDEYFCRWIWYFRPFFIIEGGRFF
jgi:hypothetical protein